MNASARAELRGQKCEICGHAKAAHNDLSYCQRRSKTYGECVCDGTNRYGDLTVRIPLARSVVSKPKED